MLMTRPPYASEFREQMVELVRLGRSPEELAREFEPSSQSIRNWVGQADRDEGRSHEGLTSAEREELRRRRPALRPAPSAAGAARRAACPRAPASPRCSPASRPAGPPRWTPRWPRRWNPWRSGAELT